MQIEFLVTVRFFVYELPVYDKCIHFLLKKCIVTELYDRTRFSLRFYTRIINFAKYSFRLQKEVENWISYDNQILWTWIASENFYSFPEKIHSDEITWQNGFFFTVLRKNSKKCGKYSFRLQKVVENWISHDDQILWTWIV